MKYRRPERIADHLNNVLVAIHRIEEYVEGCDPDLRRQLSLILSEATAPED
jgi:hypothetical protein